MPWCHVPWCFDAIIAMIPWWHDSIMPRWPDAMMQRCHDSMMSWCHDELGLIRPENLARATCWVTQCPGLRLGLNPVDQFLIYWRSSFFGVAAIIHLIMTVKSWRQDKWSNDNLLARQHFFAIIMTWMMGWTVVEAQVVTHRTTDREAKCSIPLEAGLPFFSSLLFPIS